MMSIEEVAVMAGIALFLAVISFAGVIYHDIHIERGKRQKREAEYKNEIVNEICSYFEQTK